MGAAHSKVISKPARISKEIPDIVRKDNARDGMRVSWVTRGSASLFGGRLGGERLGLFVFFFLRQTKGAQTDGLGVVVGGFAGGLLLDQLGALFPDREMTVGVAAGGIFLG